MELAALAPPLKQYIVQGCHLRIIGTEEMNMMLGHDSRHINPCSRFPPSEPKVSAS